MVGKAICGDAQVLERLSGKEEETGNKQASVCLPLP